MPVHLHMSMHVTIDVLVFVLIVPSLAYVPIVPAVAHLPFVSIVIAVPAALVMARMAIVIACFGHQRSGHQRHCECCYKDASHRLLLHVEFSRLRPQYLRVELIGA